MRYKQGELRAVSKKDSVARRAFNFHAFKVDKTLGGDHFLETNVHGPSSPFPLRKLYLDYYDKQTGFVQLQAATFRRNGIFSILISWIKTGISPNQSM